MSNKKAIRIVSGVLCGVMCLTVSSSLLSACGKKKKSSIVIMTEELSGLFNPFYATSGADMDVVGMTQIGMLTTKYDNTATEKADKVKTMAGKDYATVALDYDVKPQGSDTVYTFVIKNDLKFSDGKPLTMNDVLFNMYEYLDPVYTGSSTMYSTKIKGLANYRLQQKNFQSSTASDEQASLLAKASSMYARTRAQTLVDLFTSVGETTPNSYSMTTAQMEEAIKQYDVPSGYMDAVASTEDQANMTMDDYRAQLLADYNFTLETFKKELETDYKTAKEAFDLTALPYSEWKDKLNNDVFKFFLYEGYIKPKYVNVAGKDDKLHIEKFNEEVYAQNFDTQDKAINKVYQDMITTQLHVVLSGWGTATTVTTKYSADYTDIYLHNQTENGQLLVPNIEGIVSLGHTTNTESVVVNGTTYSVAQSHNADGTPTNAGDYDVLQITVEGTDPKAIYSFGFTVAPAHYYTADAEHPNGREIDIANNKFGVEYATSSFQSKVIQSAEHVAIPVGAGTYKATDSKNSDTPADKSFWNSNIVYFKANDNFMFEVKTKKLQLQVVSASNAIDKLANNEVDYITPQFTKANSDRLESLKKSGVTQIDTWQLGYGYIGVNAGKVPNINVRKAIMSAMNTSLSLEFYKSGQVKNISWPMSTVSWAYPFAEDGVTEKDNGHDYMKFSGDEDAKTKIKKYMGLAGVSENDPALKITFTIAGASITDHPTYNVFKHAADLLNSCGWNIEVKADSQALTKLSTGSLSVWAAAWGSTVDPDMYQVYHKNSTATSVYSWGYREIKADMVKYETEWNIINNLSEVIDDARSITDVEQRTALYETAMGYVLDLAVELPVYQRKTLYAYNSKNLKGLTTDVNPYTSPLEKIWEIELA